MAGQNFQVVPKFIGNFIEIYFVIQGNGTVYKLATLEMPNDNQMVLPPCNPPIPYKNLSPRKNPLNHHFFIKISIHHFQSKLTILEKFTKFIVSVYKLATLEMPNDNQMVDNVDFAKQLCDLYKKRIRKSIR